MATLDVFTDPSLTIIFATSPTGLGHLRVTDALYHGLPPKADPVLLGTHSPAVSTAYRWVSNNSLTRWAMEAVQIPPFDRVFASVGRKLLRSETTVLYEELKAILNERFTVPKTVLLIAPHTILGHQLGEIKEKLAKELGITILLVVQVTDDSPQAIWYVYDADVIFVPSEYTKGRLMRYAKDAKLPHVPLIVTAYPISPLLSAVLPKHAFDKRLEQTDPVSQSAIHMTVPVSGAAVGTLFMANYMQVLHRLSDRFVFHVISRDAPYTSLFVQSVSQLPYVKLFTSAHDRTTVANYELVFDSVPVALEITKPSEQAFKALATPKQRGGVVMLFSKPVGKQEYDNLYFLRSHGMMPTLTENNMLWRLAEKNKDIDGDLKNKAYNWRALRLPDAADKAASFTLWCLNQKIFWAMMHYHRAPQEKELQSDGVAQFWSHVADLLEEKQKNAAV